jgi:hypothetical protein
MSTSYAEAMTQLRDYDELERKYEHCLRLIDAYEMENTEIREELKRIMERLDHGYGNI